jgi:hypothetical protein
MPVALCPDWLFADYTALRNGTVEPISVPANPIEDML